MGGGRKRLTLLGSAFEALVGAGMKSNPGIAAKMFRTLAERGINIEDLYTSSYLAPHTGTPMFALHVMAVMAERLRGHVP